MRNLRLYGNEYYAYMEMLSSGNCFKILISKRLLFRPMLPLWCFIFATFLVPSTTFFAVIGLPVFVVFATHLIMQFPFWSACNISRKAYVVFHTAFLLLLKIVSIPIVVFMEVL